MTRSQSLVLLILALFVFAIAALPVALFVDRFPAWVGLLVLTGVLVPGLLLSLLAARWLVGERRAEFAARLQQRQVIFSWACVAAAIGGFPLMTFGNRVLEVIGLVIAAAAGGVAFWTVLRAVPQKPTKNTGSSSAAGPVAAPRGGGT